MKSWVAILLWNSHSHMQTISWCSVCKCNRYEDWKIRGNALQQVSYFFGLFRCHDQGVSMRWTSLTTKGCPLRRLRMERLKIEWCWCRIWKTIIDPFLCYLCVFCVCLVFLFYVVVPRLSIVCITFGCYSCIHLLPDSSAHGGALPLHT